MNFIIVDPLFYPRPFRDYLFVDTLRIGVLYFTSVYQIKQTETNHLQLVSVYLRITTVKIYEIRWAFAHGARYQVRTGPFSLEG